MHRPLVPHRIVLTLIATALLLPITICVVFGVAGLLGKEGFVFDACFTELVQKPYSLPLGVAAPAYWVHHDQVAFVTLHPILRALEGAPVVKG